MALTKITTSVVAVNSLTAANIADNSIDATKIANNQILARHIAAGALSDQIAANSITAAMIPNATALTLDGGVTIDNITIDGTEIDVSSGDLILDVAGDIILDADGGDILFKDAGSLIGFLSMASSNLNLTNNASNGDIIFTGNDGGSSVTALTLDMSERGNATFNGSVSAYANSDTVAGLDIYSDANHGIRILHRATDGDFSFERRDAGTNTEFLRIGRSTGKAIYASQIEVGTFPVSTTNSGEAWIGRAADRQDGSFTIQLGGDSASGTNFEIVDRAWSKVPFFVSGEAPSNALGVNAGGIIKIRTAGNVADGTYYSAMTINNTGTNTFSGIRFDRSDVAKWRAGLRNDDKFQISNLFTNGSSGSPNDDAFVITNTNRVGINNASPDATLTVGGGESNYVRIDNAASGDVSSGYQIYSGSTLTTQLYGNASEGWTTVLSGGALNFRVNNASSGFNPVGIDTSGRVSMPYQPCFCVYNPAGTYHSSTTDPFGKGTFSTYMNVGSHFSTTTGRFTAPIAGNYYFSFSAMFDSSGDAGFDFRINGTAKNGGEGLDFSSDTYTQIAGSIIFALSANDYVTLTTRGRRIHQRYGSFEGFLIG